MYEVVEDKTLKWGKYGKGKYIVPLHIDILCPNIDCRTSLVGVPVEWIHSGIYPWARLVCPICDELEYLFVMDPRTDTDQENNSRVFVYPRPAPDVEITTGIEKVSPDFERIYYQAIQAGERGLDELEGMGYRKALEFLVKDYLKYLNPDDEKATTRIENMTLGQCIAEINDEDLKDIAQATNWIGTDETHYVRRWEGKDINDLITLMNIVMHLVSEKLSIDLYKNELKKRKEQQFKT